MTVEPATTDLWAAVDTMIGELDFPSLEANGLVALRAGSRSASLVEADRARLAVQLIVARRQYADAVEAVTRIVENSRQRIVLIKGPEVAQRYPEPAQRPFSDLDLLVADPELLAEDLHRLGYRSMPGIVPDGHHHLAPMVDAGGVLPVEIHRRPGWLSWMTPPDAAVLLGRAVPAESPVTGLWTLDPVDHCLVVAVHAWADGAFRRIQDLVDVAVMRGRLDPVEVADRAESWGIARMWRTTERCIDARFGDGPSSNATRLLTGHLQRGRVRGPVRHRAAVYLADFLVTAPGRAATSAAHKLRASEVLGSFGR